jgi:2-polyprenyl-3-methyl-5-hydroxy-6-metoxy-1,4-benzoquinol methylase
MPPVLDPEGAHLASLRRLASFEHASVVEVGCGDGRLTSSLAEEAASIVAFDPEADAVATANNRLAADLAERVTFRVGSARQIEIPRTQFDIVVFSWSL